MWSDKSRRRKQAAKQELQDSLDRLERERSDLRAELASRDQQIAELQERLAVVELVNLGVIDSPVPSVGEYYICSTWANQAGGSREGEPD